MGRWACVDVPALPLQLLLQRHPEWADGPAAVVAEDSPQARILWVNEPARRVRILPGMRYAAALSLSRELRAGVVPREEIDAGVRRLATRLRDGSPDVEPAAGEPGVFWLDGEGLEHVFRSAAAWGRVIHSAVSALGFAARVVVGFTRYGTYAVARSSRADAAAPVVFRDPAEEQLAARAAPLERLGLEPALRDDLDKLGVTTLSEFLELSADGVHERFGDAAARMHRLASGAAWSPLQPLAPEERLAAREELGYADADIERLLFVLKRLLDPLLERLAARREAARELRVELKLDTGRCRHEALRPAQPTRAAAQLLDLVRLRLESAELDGKVEELEVELLGVKLDAEQARLFAEQPRRDLAAANRALARLRAEFGPESVVRARVRDGHLPEASFLWEPLAALDEGAPPPARAGDAPPVLVRRIAEKPEPLPSQSHHLRDDGWLIHHHEHGAVTKMSGPYVVSGGWWTRPVHREYHFAHTARGDLLWVYFDRQRRRWFLHGHVE
ncbi:MAG: DNA polymerase Y family protein [Acidobacteria bacterium]|nr:DNA polymerase Y family protein [Acidobacteriota bacterium]